MRKILAMGLLLGLVDVAQASETNVLVGMAKKFGYGTIDTLTGVVELPMQTYKGYANGIELIKNKPTSKVVGTVLGFFRGIGHAAARTVYGAINVVTFWSANRETNEGVGIPL